MNILDVLDSPEGLGFISDLAIRVQSTIRGSAAAELPRDT